MKTPNIQSQGMLKMLQDLYLLLENGKQERACNIRERVGLELKYWTKLTNNHLIINTSAAKKPVYKWNTIKPNIYMALETLSDYPNFNNPLIKNTDEFINQYEKEHILHRCLNCGQIFKPERTSAKYCSDKCRVAYNRKKEKGNNEDEKVLFETPITPKQENIIPPKSEWVKKYCKQRGNGIDAEHFIRYYNDKDWKIKAGKQTSRMKNWKMAIHTWESNQKRPIQINQVANISGISDNDLISELKKRGYSGDVNKKIEF